MNNKRGKCLEIADSRTDNGAPAQQGTKASSNPLYQQWSYGTG